MANEMQIIAAGSGWGAVNMGTGWGPEQLLRKESCSQQVPFELFESLANNAWLNNYYDSSLNTDHYPLSGPEGDHRIAKALEAFQHHFQEILKCYKLGKRPLVLGGDHSLAIATWSAVSNYLKRPYGLIWIDAHLDSHTLETSPSGGLFGMPVAALLGIGDKRLTSLGGIDAKILPNNLAYIGTRDYELEEMALVEKLGIKVYTAEDVRTHGFASIFKAAKQWVTKDTGLYGISIDIDAFDPSEAPGTGAAVANGLLRHDVLPALRNLTQTPDLIALEIVEYNPKLDVNHQTAHLIWALIYSLCGGDHDAQSFIQQSDEQVTLPPRLHRS